CALRLCNPTRIARRSERRRLETLIEEVRQVTVGSVVAHVGVEAQPRQRSVVAREASECTRALALPELRREYVQRIRLASLGVGLEDVRRSVRIRLKQIHVGRLIDELEERVGVEIAALGSASESAERYAPVVTKLVIQVQSHVVLAVRACVQHNAVLI